uniref:Uncharacterized protein n=1 Tax=Anguilla anguilla TaxID=7936 RepID=A0A0E9R6T0_ANGAN
MLCITEMGKGAGCLKYLGLGMWHYVIVQGQHAPLQGQEDKKCRAKEVRLFHRCY